MEVRLFVTLRLEIPLVSLATPHHLPLLPGEWEESHTLLQPRHHHCSWLVEDGIILIGGHGSKSSTEIVQWGGTVEELFTLKYETT